MTTNTTNPEGPATPPARESLAAGLDIKGRDASLHQRIEIGAPVRAPRVAIDADWSKRKKALVSAAAAGVAVLALGAGVALYLRSIPPELPRTAEEALAVMTSASYARLDPMRQRQYAAEAARLVMQMPDDQRRALRDDPKAREAMQRIREENMDEAARRLARGETPEFPMMPFGRPGGPGGPGAPPTPGAGQPGGPGGPGAPGGPGGPGGRGNWANGQMPEEVRQRIVGRMEQRIMTGNAQNSGLRTEMMQRFMRQGGPGAPGAPGGR